MYLGLEQAVVYVGEKDYTFCTVSVLVYSHP